MTETPDPGSAPGRGDDPSPEPDAKASAAEPTEVPVGRWPLVFFMGLVVVLLNWPGLPLMDSAFVALLVVLLPILTIAQLRAIPHLVLERTSAYKSSMGTIALLALIALGLGFRRFGWEGLGLEPIPVAELALWGLGMTVLGLLVMFAFLGIRMVAGWSETPFLELMTPQSGPERRLFVGVSFAAGFGEEIVFRGYLLQMSWELLPGVWVPAAICAVLFGIVHAYQGWLGIVRTSILGLLLSTSMIASGTLWPAIVAHVLIDLFGGLVFAKTLTQPPSSVRAAKAME